MTVPLTRSTLVWPPSGQHGLEVLLPECCEGRWCWPSSCCLLQIWVEAPVCSLFDLPPCFRLLPFLLL